MRLVSKFSPGAILIQETKFRRKKQFEINDYDTFELIRKDWAGGGLYTAVHKSLNAVEVPTETDNEILVVEASLGQSRVRFINGYGPQEYASESCRKQFFHQLDLEVKKAKLVGSLICIEMDSNAKLGSAIIPSDPRPQSDNGKLLEAVITENNLVVVNGQSLCKGTITRYRNTVNGEEKSVLDHFIVCDEFFQFVKSI